MVPGCDGGVFDGSVAVDCICVRDGVERNTLVAWVRVQSREIVGVWGGWSFHFYVSVVLISIYEKYLYINFVFLFITCGGGDYPLKISFVAGLKYNVLVSTPAIGTCRMGFTKKPA